MSVCPITYEPLQDGENYSTAGLRSLSPRLRSLADLPNTAAEQVQEAAARAGKMSIQGVQPKLSARLNVAEGRFDIVDRKGRFILKPQNPSYAHLPENEDLVMRLASSAGIDVPLHGLARSKDGAWTYFVRRFDRMSRDNRLAVEDFAQLTGQTRETKYRSTMEQVAAAVDRYCTFPALERRKLFLLTAFNYLVGNEDMHLKNFSVLTRDDVVALSPAYDLVSTSLVLRDPEELALPLRGKQRRLTREDIIDYFGCERLEIPERDVHAMLGRMSAVRPEWHALIGRSFLPAEYRQRLEYLIASRWRVLMG